MANDATKPRNPWVLPFVLGGAVFAAGCICGALIVLAAQINVQGSMMVGTAVHDSVRDRDGRPSDSQPEILSTP
jgi:hypothetical protein